MRVPKLMSKGMEVSSDILENIIESCIQDSVEIKPVIGEMLIAGELSSVDEIIFELDEKKNLKEGRGWHQFHLDGRSISVGNLASCSQDIIDYWWRHNDIAKVIHKEFNFQALDYDEEEELFILAYQQNNILESDLDRFYEIRTT